MSGYIWSQLCLYFLLLNARFPITFFKFNRHLLCVPPNCDTCSVKFWNTIVVIMYISFKLQMLRSQNPFFSKYTLYTCCYLVYISPAIVLHFSAKLCCVHTDLSMWAYYFHTVAHCCALKVKLVSQGREEIMFLKHFKIL